VISYEALIVFSVTTALTCFTPGPAALFVASSAASYGKSHIPAALLGIAVANIGFFGLSALGIAGLIASSPLLFQWLRWLGAAYLVVLGLQLILSRKQQHLQVVLNGQTGAKRLRTFLNAFVVEASNPKALLYFGALLPQFINPTQALAPQLLVYCLLTFVFDIAAYSFYGVLGLGIAKASKQKFYTLLTRLAGIAFLFAGLRLALTM
jgi:homoserine/homoserine lactone efflux protein